MALEHSLWRTVRWPLLILLIGTIGVVTATILDKVYRSEWSLTIGAPAPTPPPDRRGLAGPRPRHPPPDQLVSNQVQSGRSPHR